MNVRRLASLSPASLLRKVWPQQFAKSLAYRVAAVAQVALPFCLLSARDRARQGYRQAFLTARTKITCLLKANRRVKVGCNTLVWLGSLFQCLVTRMPGAILPDSRCASNQWRARCSGWVQRCQEGPGQPTWPFCEAKLATCQLPPGLLEVRHRTVPWPDQNIFS